MSKITRIEVMNVDLKAKVARSDAIQSFTKQETPMVRIFTDDGQDGTGYAYTIGNGSSAVVAMVRDTLAPWLIGRNAERIEEIWKGLFFLVHANAVGPTASLAIAALDTALWDLRCKRAGLPLHVMAGGAQKRVPVYNTEGGWLNFTPDELVAHAVKAREEGFRGFKVKVGRPHVSEDVQRLRVVREALGSGMELMVDANQLFDVPEAIRRARHFEELDLAWFEEPMPAEDLNGHVRLSASTSLPVAIGESLYHLSHFREYLQRDACSVVQVDVARIGGITPWLKVAHLAESFNVPVNPHYLMELHVSLCAAVPNSQWVEYIPQLDDITHSRMKMVDGYAVPSDAPGNGIDWNWDAIQRMRDNHAVIDGK
ncbi:mandelate racemase/muconate lactonizing enzyme family protein [Pseudorhodoferax sp.]|uniref:mandelate racemase/muconate lactonizing enzyme family protein n=1 Tax=Pseudorhodoferax sp. TaxID=1993553 RepID=UPI002DD658BC|nr:mandelate racemase/muconate lactonizing enzyme family protein [Pseudorhodoferax sp.]